MYYSYILKSIKDGRYYYGSTGDLEKRILKHNQGGVPSTKNRRPLKLHYFETFESKLEAQKRERFYKSIDGYRYLKENSII
jgi:putative endonuclease